MEQTLATAMKPKMKVGNGTLTLDKLANILRWLETLEIPDDMMPSLERESHYPTPPNHQPTFSIHDFDGNAGESMEPANTERKIRHSTSLCQNDTQNSAGLTSASQFLVQNQWVLPIRRRNN